jgi:hypothetical protein
MGTRPRPINRLPAEERAKVVAWGRKLIVRKEKELGANDDNEVLRYLREVARKLDRL